MEQSKTIREIKSPSKTHENRTASKMLLMNPAAQFQVPKLRNKTHISQCLGYSKQNTGNKKK